MKSNSVQVIKFLQKIPAGKVVSYKFLAKKFGLHPRTIGTIMRQNREPNIFPCYKIIQSDGKIGGYNGGCKEKIKRLRFDDIIITKGKIHEKYFRYGKD